MPIRTSEQDGALPTNHLAVCVICASVSDKKYPPRPQIAFDVLAGFLKRLFSTFYATVDSPHRAAHTARASRIRSMAGSRRGVSAVLREVQLNTNAHGASSDLDRDALVSLRENLETGEYEIDGLRYEPFTFLSGSYARHTCITPVRDVDIFLRLKPIAPPFAFTTWFSPRRRAALDALHAVEAWARHWGVPYKLQRRSIQLRPPCLNGVTVDIVPAIPCYDDPSVFWIPDVAFDGRQAHRWLRSCPDDAKAACTEANRVMF